MHAVTIATREAAVPEGTADAATEPGMRGKAAVKVPPSFRLLPERISATITMETAAARTDNIEPARLCAGFKLPRK